MPPYTPDIPSTITTATVIKVRRIAPQSRVTKIRSLGHKRSQSVIDEECVPDLQKIESKKRLLTYIRDGDFDIVWANCFIFTIAHLMYFYSLYFILIHSANVRHMYTWMFGYSMGVAGGLGITAGAHRLWSHKSYEARLPLRIFLMIGKCQYDESKSISCFPQGSA